MDARLLRRTFLAATAIGLVALSPLRAAHAQAVVGNACQYGLGAGSVIQGLSTSGGSVFTPVTCQSSNTWGYPILTLQSAAAAGGSSCTGYATGALRFNSTLGIPEFCDGTSWNVVGKGSSIYLGSSALTPNPAASATDTTTGLYTSGTGHVDFTSQGAQTLDVSSSGMIVPIGSVGIDTVAPQVPLQIDAGGFGYTSLILTGGQNNGTKENQLLFRNGFWVNNSTSGFASVIGQDDSGYGGNLIFATAADGGGAGGSPTEHMRILANGNVGIGTTQPTTSLDVKGPGAITPSLSADVGTMTINNGNNLELQIGQVDNGGAGIFMQSKNVSNDGTAWQLYLNPLGGNVGIGTTGPTALLQVGSGGTTGKLSVLSQDHAVGQLQIGNPNGGAEASIGFFEGATAGTDGLSGATSWVIGPGVDGIGSSFGIAGSSTFLTITSSGLVGIGTTLPQVSLDLGQRTDAILLPTGSTSQRPSSPVNGMLRYNSYTNSLEAYTDNAWGGLGGTAQGSSGDVQFNSGGNLAADSNLYWDNTNKRLGIGTTMPVASLDLSANSDGLKLETVSATAGQSCTSTQQGEIRYNSNASVNNIEFCDGSNWRFLAAGSTSCGTPTGLSFTNVTGAALSTVTTSGTATITYSGCTSAMSVSVTGGGSPQISVNGGAWVTSGTINSGQTLQVRLTSSSSPSTPLTATVTVDTSSTNWSVTTAAADPCSGSPAVGTVCSDGSVYAGVTPDGNVPMYAAPCDAGMTGSAGSCTGTRSNIYWSAGDTVTTGVTNVSTGKANTSTLHNDDGNADTPYSAADYCYNLNYLGHTDWYLPSQAELQILIQNQSSIGGFGVYGDCRYGGSFYWSSTEHNTTTAYGEESQGASASPFTKSVPCNGGVSGFTVRCVRHN